MYQNHCNGSLVVDGRFRIERFIEHQCDGFGAYLGKDLEDKKV